MEHTEPEAIFAWQVFESGEWGTIAAGIPGVSAGPTPLVTRRLDLALQMEPLALVHAQATGLPVEMHRFAFDPSFVGPTVSA